MSGFWCRIINNDAFEKKYEILIAQTNNPYEMTLKQYV